MAVCAFVAIGVVSGVINNLTGGSAGSGTSTTAGPTKSMDSGRSNPAAIKSGDADESTAPSTPASATKDVTSRVKKYVRSYDKSYSDAVFKATLDGTRLTVESTLYDKPSNWSSGTGMGLCAALSTLSFSGEVPVLKDMTYVQIMASNGARLFDAENRERPVSLGGRTVPAWTCRAAKG